MEDDLYNGAFDEMATMFYKGVDRGVRGTLFAAGVIWGVIGTPVSFFWAGMAKIREKKEV